MTQDKDNTANAPKKKDDKQLIRFDWAMKYILRSPANFDVLESFLSAVLNDQIKIENIIESEGNKKEENEKFNRVDIRCKNSKGHVIIIEVQNTGEADYLQRILFGISETVFNHVDLGKPYMETPKVYSISIVYFKLGTGDDYIYRGRYEFKGLHTQQELCFTDKQRKALGIDSPSEPMPETYFLMVQDFDKVAKTPLEEWMRFLKEGRIDPDTKDQGLRSAREKLDIMKLSREEQNRYIRYGHDAASFALTQRIEKEIAFKEGEEIGTERGIEIGTERGIEIGTERGIKQEKIETARRSKAENISIDIIAKITGLTVDEINEL